MRRFQFSISDSRNFGQHTFAPFCLFTSYILKSGILRLVVLVKTILFVDDHEVLARLSCEILEMQGYRAVSAYNGEDALKKFENFKYDMVVTDMRMDGMNGLQLARKLRSQAPELPIVIVTGYGPVDCGNEVNACLSKEELFPALLEQIKLHLGDPELGASESESEDDEREVRLKTGS